MRITDVAKAVAPECDIEIIGIRPGEKLHEVLITEEEARATVSYNGMYIIMPSFSWWEKKNYLKAEKLPKGFVYTSDKNMDWLDEDDLRRIIGLS